MTIENGLFVTASVCMDYESINMLLDSHLFRIFFVSILFDEIFFFYIERWIDHAKQNEHQMIAQNFRFSPISEKGVRWVHLLAFEWPWYTFRFFLHYELPHASHRMRVPSFFALFNRLACQCMNEVEFGFYSVSSITFRECLFCSVFRMQSAQYALDGIPNIGRERSISIQNSFTLFGKEYSCSM